MSCFNYVPRHVGVFSIHYVMLSIQTYYKVAFLFSQFVFRLVFEDAFRIYYLRSCTIGRIRLSLTGSARSSIDFSASSLHSLFVDKDNRRKHVSLRITSSDFFLRVAIRCCKLVIAHKRAVFRSTSTTPLSNSDLRNFRRSVPGRIDSDFLDH